MLRSAHTLRVLLVSTAGAVSLGLALDLMSAAYTTAHVAHQVLGSLTI